MHFSAEARTPEGDENTCSVCGAQVRLEPSRPPGDAVCPQCGALMWFPKITELTDTAIETADQLAEAGAFIEAEEDGQVTAMRFVGPMYNDAAVRQLGQMFGLATIDIRETDITELGATRLRVLMPNTRVIHGKHPGENS